MILGTDERGQTNTLGIAIVLVLALASALLVTSVGSVTLEEGRQLAETESGVRTMTELDSRASLVALGGGSSATIDVSRRAGSGRVSVQQQGEMRFVFRNTTANATVWQRNVSLGTVVYENGDDRIAYQGGGVWRRTAGTNGSVMVSPPEVNYETGTLTLPMVNVSGNDRGISTATIRKVGENRIYPIPSQGRNFSNPVPGGNELVIYVQSDYYRAWADFFRTRIGGNVTVFPGNRTVRVDLRAPEDPFKVDAGLISVGTGSEINMIGNGANPSFVDSYNSSVGNYTTSQSDNGTIRSPTGLDLNGNSYVYGTIDTSGPVTLASQSAVYGNVWHQGLNQQGQATVTGKTKSNGTGVDIEAIDETLNDRTTSICAPGNHQDLPDTTATINASTSSTYCYDGNLRYDGETLTIDLSDGNVSIAVTGDLEIKNYGEIEVVNASGNDHTVELWLAGDDVTLKGGGKVIVEGDDSRAFRLYAGSTTQVSMTSPDTKFVGVLFAPSDGSSLLKMQKAELFGAAIAGEVQMNAGSTVHYDQALEGFQFDRTGTVPDRLTYLYVTIHEVEIEDR